MCNAVRIYWLLVRTKGLRIYTGVEWSRHGSRQENLRAYGSLENAVTTLTEMAGKHEVKLDKLLSDVDQAKGSLNTFKWVFGVVVPIGTAIGVVVLETLLKHFRLL